MKTKVKKTEVNKSKKTVKSFIDLAFSKYGKTLSKLANE